MRIVFMGTPDFAVASLDRLIKNHYSIAAVVTAPDKPAGRGQKLTESAVKKYAKEKQLPILQPEKLKSPEFIQTLKSLNADLQIVVAFRMLPEIVWNMPPLGTFNLHASLLPQYRGAAPINWAIINGEKESGVTTFFLKHEIDTGNIILQEKVSITPTETAGELHDKLMNTGAELVLKTVRLVENKSYKLISQDKLTSSNKELKHAPKIFKQDCAIDWKQPIDQIYNLIRGLSPYPTAYTTFKGQTLKIFHAKKEYEHHNDPIGSFILNDKLALKVAVKEGYILLTEVQLEGKKRMSIEDFLRGNRL